MTDKIVKAAVLVCWAICTQPVCAQETFALEEKPSLKISGTSSLHDWEMTSELATGKMEAQQTTAKLVKITGLTVSMPSESLKSGKKAMDKNTYKALKTDQNKNIKFDLKKAEKTSDGNWSFTGSFTIAGVTKQVAIKVVETASASQFIFDGSYSFKLTDYKITPPTAVMGTIKTGDEVKISFKIKFKKH